MGEIQTAYHSCFHGAARSPSAPPSEPDGNPGGRRRAGVFPFPGRAACTVSLYRLRDRIAAAARTVRSGVLRDVRHRRGDHRVVLARRGGGCQRRPDPGDVVPVTCRNPCRERVRRHPAERFFRGACGLSGQHVDACQPDHVPADGRRVSRCRATYRCSCRRGGCIVHRAYSAHTLKRKCSTSPSLTT